MLDKFVSHTNRHTHIHFRAHMIMNNNCMHYKIENAVDENKTNEATATDAKLRRSVYRYIFSNQFTHGNRKRWPSQEIN